VTVIEDLTRTFEANREHIRGVAYRMLGSLSEAEDAVQEAWLRVSRSDPQDIKSYEGWLTTVVSRICLDMLRARKARAEAHAPEVIARRPSGGDPESDAVLADSVGVALLVVLDTLEPAERLAFVLHDIFAVPFDEIASIVGRSADATRQLASRARRRVQGGDKVQVSEAELARQQKVVSAFLAALRAGDVQALLAVLDPDVVVRTPERTIRGAEEWAQGAVRFARALGVARVEAALVDGSVGIVARLQGGAIRVLRMRFRDDKVVEAEIIDHPDALALAVLP
jgi:RNA polymerase sigma-70 factor (ECF subfamily)